MRLEIALLAFKHMV